MRNHTLADSLAASMTMTITASMHSMTVVGHLSHIAIVVVGVVVDMLNPAVRQQHRVGSLSHSCTVVRLVLVEVSPRVTVLHTIAEVVGNSFVVIIVAMAVRDTMTPMTTKAAMSIAWVSVPLVVSTDSIVLGIVARIANMTITASMHSMTVVGHLSHIAIVVVGVVVDMLSPAVRQQHRVGSLSHSCTVVRLVLVEVSPRVTVLHTIVEVVGNRLVVIVVAMGNTTASMASIAASIAGSSTGKGRSQGN